MNGNVESASRAVDVLHEVGPQSLYVHIPFCKSRCFYCDFTTYVAPKGAIDNYVENLLREFEQLAPLAGESIQTIFFGGGTPTLLSAEQWRAVLGGLRSNFNLSKDVEISVEANPGSITENKLEALLEGGANRLSFGAQTFSDRLLLAIGRLHDAQTIRQSLQLAKNAGFERINLDLMFGLPEQSTQDVQDSIDEVIRLGVTHLSAYWLKVEQGTPFAKWEAGGMLPLPGEDEEGDMYDLVRSRLARHGFLHYEVSNFCIPGEEARHNLVYWRNEPYLAAGVGAHGYNRGVRYENVKSLSDYAASIAAGERPVASQITVPVTESMEDTMMLGLRLQEGVSRGRFHTRHGVPMDAVFGDVIRPLVSSSLLEWDGDTIRLTERAWPVANAVFERFVGALSD